MEDASTNKREREESDGSPGESPEEKRLREDLLLDDIFDDDTDAGGEQDLASVMKSLEEEIALPSPPSALSEPAAGEERQPDLGYLLEASDDELGLPPTMPSSEEDGEVESTDNNGHDDAGLGQIWGLVDEISGEYDNLDFPDFRAEERESPAAGGDDGNSFDDALFDFSDTFYGAADLAELPWRPESLPAV
ncbi:hypothetical protein AXF42_Ash018134 [Apostasia shenzhenica]|uniref:Uncharacterized protein n=1 Tax=Apostasia shenzhenica TaxID=1088818 RepID=A0A2I0AEY5_9ASPA|nr:hypothetical protein AXF42_Ash018134 [Apostasia shenzhenica]